MSTVILIVVLCIFLLWWWVTRGDREYVCDGDECFYVCKYSPDKVAAVRTLAEIDRRIRTFEDFLEKKYFPNGIDDSPGAAKDFVRRIFLRYNPDFLVETCRENPEGNTAYSTFKGALLSVCLGSDINTTMFAVLHELTHVGLLVAQHPPEFWVGFAWLLREATEAGIYIPVDYHHHPVNYCGIEVASNPMFDL